MSSGLSSIEMMAPARIRLRALSGRIASETPRPARMKENSPICASDTEMESAVGA
jgi:hypothetical protein